MADRDLVFFSYRHDKDGERWLGALQGMLEPYVQGSRLVLWSDRDIRVGDQWHGRIQDALARTRVAVLLVNQRYFGSDYVCRLELPRLVADARAGRLRLVTVAIGHLDEGLLQQHGLADFQAANGPDKPLSDLRGSSREKALVALAMQVYRAYGSDDAADATPAVAVRQGATAADGRGDGQTLGPLLDVPPYQPARYVARPDDLVALRARLLSEGPFAHGVTAAAPGLGVHGMGGMGKTVLVQALCHDHTLRLAFPDGVAWVALGQTPDLQAALNRLLRLFDAQAAPAESVSDASQRLRGLLAGRCALIVVDDVWSAEHVRPFDVVQGRSRLLLTTRDASVLGRAGALRFALHRLPLDLSRQLLALHAQCPIERLPPAADEVVQRTAGLPLALALAGAQVADGVPWATLRDELRQGHIDFLDHAYGSIYASLGRSVDALPAAESERYGELAVFPEDLAVPVPTIARLWRHTGGLSPAQTDKLLAKLDRRALLTLSGAEAARTVALHDLQLDFVRLRAADLSALHRRLLDAYRAGLLAVDDGTCPWARLPPDEPYLWPHLARHLVSAGLDDELEAALLDLDWIRARVAAATRRIDGRDLADLWAVTQDFGLAAPGSPARQVQHALKASSHRLSPCPQGLDQHLHGRLGHWADGPLGALANAAHRTLQRRDDLAPTLPALAAPGPLEATLIGHTRGVNGVLLLSDGRLALSWGSAGSLRLWDLEAAAERQVPASDDVIVDGALALPDGRRALTWTLAERLRLWDLETPAGPTVLDTQRRTIKGALLLSDGHSVVMWADDHTLCVRDLDDRIKPRTLAGHGGAVLGALQLADGRHVLSWSRDLTLRLWDLKAGLAPQVFGGHKGEIRGALALPDGRRALSWSEDHTLRLWDLEAGTKPRVLAGHEGEVLGASLLHDGCRALSWSRDHTLRLWDLEAATELRVFSGHRDVVNGALLVPGDRRALSWSDDGSLRLWDLVVDVEPRVLSGHRSLIKGALLLHDQRRALSWSVDGSLRLWDLEGGAEPRVLAGHEGEVHGAQLLPDGRRALSWSEDGTLRLWNLQDTGPPTAPAGPTGRINGALLVDGRQVLSWAGDGAMCLWDLETAALSRVLSGHEGEVNGAHLLPGGDRVLSWSDDRTLRLWRLDDGAELRVMSSAAGGVRGALLLQDDRRLLSWQADPTLRLWDLEAQDEARVLTGHAEWVRGALALPDGCRALSWSNDRALCLWDLEHVGKPRLLVGHERLVLGALLLPDGKRALSWSADGTLRLWDLEAAAELGVLARHRDWVCGALLMPGGRHALSWSWDQTLRVFDLEAASESRMLRGHQGWVTGALLLPNGRHALSWSTDGTLRLWDAETGTELRALSGHEAAVEGALLLPDGRRALSWSADRSLLLWNLNQPRPIARYDADAVITAVVCTPDGRSAWLGDALRRVQVLRIAA